MIRFWSTLLAGFTIVAAASDPPPREKSLPATFSWPPGMAPRQQVTAQDAVALALWNNTALEADLTALGVAKAEVLDARLLRNPNLWALLPVGGKPFEVLLNWPIEEIRQRRKRVQAAQANFDALAKGLEQNGLNLIRDVTVAHADLWAASRRLETLRESWNLRERIATLTEKRQAAGDASGFDVSLMRADALSAQELSRRAEGEVEFARTRLRMLLGLRNSNEPLEAVIPDADPAPGLDLPSLVEAAHSARPDLRSAELAIQAAAQRAKWQRSRVMNMLTAILSVKQAGSPQQVRTGPGFQVEAPLLNRNQGLIARADAEVVQAGWRYAALRDRVEQEVRESYARWRQAAQSRDDLRTTLMPAVERSIGQMEQALRHGDASVLNTLETARQRYDVKLRELEAAASAIRAKAELERATGKRL